MNVGGMRWEVMEWNVMGMGMVMVVVIERLLSRYVATQIFT
jgi:uncharacterized membrane-anchored protein YhcB (DUF1043 family)